jgi:hypothetical protein
LLTGILRLEHSLEAVSEELGFVVQLAVLTRGDVTDDGDLRGKLQVTEKECAEELGNRAFPEPGVYGIEDKFVAAVRISGGENQYPFSVWELELA